MAPNRIGIIATAVASIAVIAGCSAHSATTPAKPAAHSTTTPASPVPANPVPVLKMTGATTSAVNGTEDIYGDRVADGWFAGTAMAGCQGDGTDDCDETVTVRTYASAAAQARAEASDTPQDGQAEITGNLFDVWVQAVNSGTSFPVSAATIAARVHGHVVSS